MAPTSAADPERARRQRELDQSRWDVRESHDEYDRESDWIGMLLGLALAISGVLTVTAVIHLYLRYF